MSLKARDWLAGLSGGGLRGGVSDGEAGCGYNSEPVIGWTLGGQPGGVGHGGVRPVADPD